MASENDDPQEVSTGTLVLTALRQFQDFEFDIEEVSRRAQEATDRFVPNAENLTEAEKLGARYAARIDDPVSQARFEQSLHRT